MMYFSLNKTIYWCIDEFNLVGKDITLYAEAKFKFQTLFLGKLR
jgi:hypothetical protein